MVKLDEDAERAKDQAGTLTRKLEKSRSQNARLVEQVSESIVLAAKKEDNEMRDAELAELRKASVLQLGGVGGGGDRFVVLLSVCSTNRKTKC